MTLSELFDKADEMVNKRYPDCNASIKERNSYRDGYIHGMTEQLEGMIPIEKAKAWVKNCFIGPFGEGLADNIANEFAKYLEEQKYEYT